MTQINLTGTTKERELYEIRIDTLLQTLITKTPAEISDYIDDNVNTIADVKSLLKKMAIILIALAKDM